MLVCLMHVYVCMYVCMYVTVCMYAYVCVQIDRQIDVDRQMFIHIHATSTHRGVSKVDKVKGKKKTKNHPIDLLTIDRLIDD